MKLVNENIKDAMDDLVIVGMESNFKNVMSNKIFDFIETEMRVWLESNIIPVTCWNFGGIADVVKKELIR